ncbi:MAG: NAD(P)-dependent oxidoreductase [Nitrospirota bacterium]
MTYKKPLVYYTHKAPPEGPDLLKPFCEVIENESYESPSKRDIILSAKNAHALCCFVLDLIDEEIVASCSQLRIISIFARGYDNVDVAAATRRGIWVTQVPELLTELTADLTWALLLAVARKLISADSFVRSGKFSGWSHPTPFLGSNIFGKTLGIIGMGELGRAIACRASGFNMTILYYQRHRLDIDRERKLSLIYVPRDEIFRQSDFICIASPLTNETFHQISTNELSLMKPSAYLINTARGSEVDEEAVAKALKEKRITGYAADVFEMEDKQFLTHPSYVNKYLIDHPDCTVLTPHLGAAVMETRIEMAKIQALNVLQALKGERPFGTVNDVPLKPAIITD